MNATNDPLLNTLATTDRPADQIHKIVAEVYETGFAAGAQHTAERYAAAALDAVPKATLHELLDRIQLFRHMLATFDTRYSILGEIIADFAAVLGRVPEPARPALVEVMRADQVNVGDKINSETHGWWAVDDVRAEGGRLRLSTAAFARYVDHREMMEVQRGTR